MLSRSAGYAIRALAHLVRARGAPLLVREVSGATGVPPSYLAKLVHTLARKGFVHTQRGTRGGVSLARRPDSITLYELSVALDEPVVQDACYLGDPACSDEHPCAAHRFSTAHRMRELKFLRGTTLADVAAFEERRDRRNPQ